MPEGLQPAKGKATKTGRMAQRPRLVINCEASIFHEMHELAHKTGRSVSGLVELAMADMLADFAAGRQRIKPDCDPQKQSATPNGAGLDPRAAIAPVPKSSGLAGPVPSA